ncbi:1951_t:CDS:2 [Acaulospora colombiana]|uniref:1951_t:CDS:1 n=1 Tax=Acaulospora colombiana TaxID=27376 RepID=A0ACA9L9A5_9GLOM|nr:1951_t:CDS:2 [Acaulospora colombiana]
MILTTEVDAAFFTTHTLVNNSSYNRITVVECLDFLPATWTMAQMISESEFVSPQAPRPGLYQVPSPLKVGVCRVEIGAEW